MQEIAVPTATPTQTSNTIVLNAKVGVPFFINLGMVPASQAPGPTWLSQYDESYLTVTRSGYSNDFEGNQSFWCEFVAKMPGETSVLYIQQPHLINPLFVSHPYTIEITS